MVDGTIEMIIKYKNSEYRVGGKWLDESKIEALAQEMFKDFIKGLKKKGIIK